MMGLIISLILVGLIPMGIVMCVKTPACEAWLLHRETNYSLILNGTVRSNNPSKKCVMLLRAFGVLFIVSGLIGMVNIYFYINL